MIYLISRDCVNCGACLDICPEGAIIEGSVQSTIDVEKCTGCGICIDEFFCPAAAIIREDAAEGEAS